MKVLYIAVLDEVPDHMVPVLVAHSVLGSLLAYSDGERYPSDWYFDWLNNSFKKCVLQVSQKEFDRIAAIHPDVYLGHESTTLEGRKSCAIPLPYESDNRPNVLKFAKLWRPKCQS